jgi:hypothetical protein
VGRQRPGPARITAADGLNGAVQPGSM